MIDSEAENQRIVIVGAGHAGGIAATSLRKLGHKGEIILIGEENWPPYERPALSKELLTGSIEPDRTFIQSIEAFSAAQIQLMLGKRVTRLNREDRSIELEDGGSIAYDTLLLATGGRLRKLPCEGADNAKVHYLRSIDDSLRLRPLLKSDARIVIVGGGLIGLEVAAAASKAGCSVTVIEQAHHLVARLLHPEVAAVFAGMHRANNVDLLLRTVIQRLEDRNGDLIVHTDDGRMIEADIVVVGIGVEPNVQLAEMAGLEVANGVVTDAFGRTSDKHIYAVGDVAARLSPHDNQHRRIETWQNAQNQAVDFARTVLGLTASVVEPVWFWTDQYGANFQFVGQSGPNSALIWRGGPASLNGIAFHIDNGKVTAASCFNPGREMRNVKRMVASGIAADHEALADITFPLAKFLAAK